MVIASPKHTTMFFSTGCVSAGLAVIAGAFAVHALKGFVETEMLTAFETASRYQMYHALALLATAWAGDRCSSEHARTVRFAGWLFIIGTALFSGSLYLLALTNARWPVILTPFGGISFVAGWLFLARCVTKAKD